MLSDLPVRPLIDIEVSRFGEIIRFERVQIHSDQDSNVVSEFGLLYFYPGFVLDEKTKQYFIDLGWIAFYDEDMLPIFVASVTNDSRKIVKLWVHWI